MRPGAVVQGKDRPLENAHIGKDVPRQARLCHLLLADFGPLHTDGGVVGLAGFQPVVMDLRSLGPLGQFVGQPGRGIDQYPGGTGTYRLPEFFLHFRHHHPGVGPLAGSMHGSGRRRILFPVIQGIVPVIAV